MLAGSGEFTPAMDEIDRDLLATLGSRPRVAIVPTAAGLEDTPPRWLEMGCTHFRALGAVPIPVAVLDRRGAHDAKWSDAIADADWIYFSGGDPGHVVASLDGTPFWQAVLARHEAGAILAGSSAGAMMLGESTFIPRARGADGLPTRMDVGRAMGLVRGVIVAPHFDVLPQRLVDLWSSLVPAGHELIGIDEDTAALRTAGAWTVRGRGRVHGALP